MPWHAQALGDEHRPSISATSSTAAAGTITAGRGRHREKFVRYEDVPREIEPKIIAEYGRKVEVE